MRVLAFDAATETGWASFADARSLPVLGTFVLPACGTNYGRRNLLMLREVAALVDRFTPQVVAYEAPFFKFRDRWHTRRLLTGLVAMIEVAAERRAARCIEVEVCDAKECLTGERRASKGMMINAAKGMGWQVMDDHQADACAVALVAYGHLQRNARVA
jgi:Holliday junction resolvasome RuvABC endonuclease subunit